MVAPGLPRHLTQRGNRRQTVFFSDDDYEAYKALAAEHCAAAGVAVWAYCLMPNHVHLILVSTDEDGLRAGLGEAALAAVRAHERTGRPLGSEAFLEGLETRLGRPLKKQKAGRKPAKTSE